MRVQQKGGPWGHDSPETPPTSYHHHHHHHPTTGMSSSNSSTASMDILLPTRRRNSFPDAQTRAKMTAGLNHRDLLPGQLPLPERVIMFDHNGNPPPTNSLVEDQRLVRAVTTEATTFMPESDDNMSMEEDLLGMAFSSGPSRRQSTSSYLGSSVTHSTSSMVSSSRRRRRRRRRRPRDDAYWLSSSSSSSSSSSNGTDTSFFNHRCHIRMPVQRHNHQSHHHAPNRNDVH